VQVNPTYESAERRVPLERPVDLATQNLADLTEEDPGASVVLNDDDDNTNEASDRAESRAVLHENDLIPVNVRVSSTVLGAGTVTLSIPEGSARVRLWADPAKQKLLGTGDGGSWQFPTEVLPAQVFVEGVAASSGPADVSLHLACKNASGERYSDDVRLTVVAVDLDVDSDNNNGLDPPARTPDEDRIEDAQPSVSQPGKYGLANDNDDDRDAIPDFADGYNRDSANADDNANANERFVLWCSSCPEGSTCPKARLKFTYSASDPVGVTTEGAVPEVRYTPAAGHFRLWNRDGAVSRNMASIAASPPGDFVPSAVVLEPAQLALLGFSATKRDVKLYLEGINASKAIGDQRILVEVDPDGPGPLDFIANDAVRVTAVKIDLWDAADGDRRIIGGYIAWIGADPNPRMPQLWAKVLPDLGNAIAAEWSMRTEYTDHGRNDIVLVPPAPAGGTQTPVRLVIKEEWNIGAAMGALPAEQRIFGGKATVKVTVVFAPPCRRRAGCRPTATRDSAGARSPVRARRPAGVAAGAARGGSGEWFRAQRQNRGAAVLNRLIQALAPLVPRSGPKINLRQLDQRFSSLERRYDFRQFRVEATQQLRATSIADADPHDRRPIVQDVVHREVLVLGHDHGVGFRSPRADPRIRSPLQRQISHVFSLVATRFNVARKRRRELSVDEKAQSCAPQDRVIVLLGRELQDRGDVLRFKVGIIRQDLFTRGAGSEQVEHVLHADAQTANARTASANVGTDGDPIERIHTDIVARLGLVTLTASS